MILWFSVGLGSGTDLFKNKKIKNFDKTLISEKIKIRMLYH